MMNTSAYEQTPLPLFYFDTEAGNQPIIRLGCSWREEVDPVEWLLKTTTIIIGKPSGPQQARPVLIANPAGGGDYISATMTPLPERPAALELRELRINRGVPFDSLLKLKAGAMDGQLVTSGERDPYRIFSMSECAKLARPLWESPDLVVEQ